MQRLCTTILPLVVSAFFAVKDLRQGQKVVMSREIHVEIGAFPKNLSINNVIH